MAQPTNTSYEIINKLFEDKITLESLVDWLKNIKNDSAHSHGLSSEFKELSQFQFISWFLNNLRIKAGQVINERKSKVSSAATSTSFVQEGHCSYSGTLRVSNETKIKTSEEVYLKEFPGLLELPSKKCRKLHRRIKPTSVQTDGERYDEKQLVEPVGGTDSNLIPSSLQISKEELLTKRFSNKKKSKKSRHAADDDFCTVFQNKCDLTDFNLNYSRSKNIDKLVNLYSALLKNYLVPNLSYEIRFILNLFDQLTENGISFSCGKKQNSDSNGSFLTSVDDWEYFCIHIIIKQEYLISKLESNILKFIANRLSLFKFEIPASYISSNLDLVFAQSGFKFYRRIFTGNKITVDDFSNEGDFVLICEQEKKFWEIEKNWYSHRSDVHLEEEIKCLLDVSSQTIWFYFLGKQFVCCLVKKIEDQNIYGSDCEQKLAQLNTRLTKPSQGNEHEPEISFHSNELFFKLWLDHCFLKCPLFIHYVRYWLIYALSALIKDTYKELVDSLCPDKRNTHLWALKIKIILAKFLGYTEFYFSRHNFKLTGNERNQLLSMQSEILPAFDLKKYFFDGITNGILVLTVPWIVEFLCMADSISALLPYYHDILFMLITLYLSYCTSHSKDELKGISFRRELNLKTVILIPQRSLVDEKNPNIEGITIPINESSLRFILIWIGRLFDNKILGESLFYDNAVLYQDKISLAKLKSGQTNWKTALDCADFVKRDLFLFCCPFFSKMKYWENSSSGYIRSIRPLPLDTKTTPESSVANIQDMLETNFLSHHQSLGTIISFISERIADICQNEISFILSPDRSTLQHPVDEVEMENSKCSYDCSHLSSENNLPSCDSLHLMKPKILTIIDNCEIKIKDSLNLLAPPGLSLAVIEACIAIASKQLKRRIINWLINEGFSSDEIEGSFMVNNLEIKSCEGNDDKVGKNRESHPFSTSVSSSFREIQNLMREMDKEKPIAHNLCSVVDKFNLISIKLLEIDEKRLLKDLYLLSWDYVLLLVCNYDDLIDDIFLTQIIHFWKGNHYGNNEERILCPRIIKEASFKSKEAQAIVAKNIAKLMLFNLKDEMISAECFETQNIAVLRYTWTKVELLFIKMYLVSLCEFLKSASFTSTPHLLSILECIIDSVNDILSLE